LRDKFKHRLYKNLLKIVKQAVLSTRLFKFSSPKPKAYASLPEKATDQARVNKTKVSYPKYTTHRHFERFCLAQL